MTPFVRPPIRDTIVRLGLTINRGRCGPCPACSECRTSDGRLPVLHTPRSWKCVICHASGGSLEMVAYKLGLVPEPMRGDTFLRVKRWVLSNEAIEVAPEEERVDLYCDPLPALRCAVPLTNVRDPGLEEWSLRRRIPLTDKAGWLPDFATGWWPRGYSSHYPVVIPACDGNGVVRSMHGIAISAEADRKTTWPRGPNSRGLLFADATMRKVLRGELPWPARVVYAEGGTDFLTASPQMPTIGVSAGAASALKLIRPPPSTRHYVATDPDRVGDLYADQIANALYPNVARRVPLHRLLG